MRIMMLTTEEQDDMRIQLAACVVRAAREWPKRDSSGWFAADNEYYWHVRETAMQLAKENGIHTGSVISAAGHLDVYDRSLDKISSELWDRVIHPEILCKEVLDS